MLRLVFFLVGERCVSMCRLLPVAMDRRLAGARLLLLHDVPLHQSSNLHESEPCDQLPDLLHGAT